MPAKPRGERGWWLSYDPAERPPTCPRWYAWVLEEPGARDPDVTREEIALWRLARLHRARIARLEREAEADLRGSPACIDAGVAWVRGKRKGA